MGCIFSQTDKDVNERSVSSLPNSTDSTVVVAQPNRGGLTASQRAYNSQDGNIISPSIHGSRGDSRINAAGITGQRVYIDSRNFASSEIDSLVLQTLKIIRTLVDNEQPPPEAMMRLHKIADKEQGWLAIVLSMINKIDCDDPLGPAVITLILDECPLPSKEAIERLTRELSVSQQSAKSGMNLPKKQRNICILYGFLAEKLAGSTSSTLLTDDVLNYLIENLQTDKEPYVILHAIVALEKFALTSENKNYIMTKLNSFEQNPLLRLEEWRKDRNFLHREVGFCVEWTLDNLFVPDNREFTYTKVDNSNRNAMLNSNDTSEYLKISPDGLEARSDVLSFESVRCTFPVDHGAWYYEVELVTNGVLQIGWATKYSKFLNYDGFGIGDDEFSLAYDGCRQLIWHNAQSKKHTHECWKPGDVLGCYIDVDNKEVVFSLNGECLPPMDEIFQNATSGFFAAASFMTFQQCVFNFGSEQFKYAPNKQFMTFNEEGTINEEDKLVLPRHRKIARIRNMSVKEDGCQVCYDNHADVKLQPCGHEGFCSNCASQLTTCPLCRVHIDQYTHTEQVKRPASRDNTSHLRTHLSHDKSSAFSENHNNEDQSVK